MKAENQVAQLKAVYSLNCMTYLGRKRHRDSQSAGLEEVAPLLEGYVHSNKMRRVSKTISTQILTKVTLTGKTDIQNFVQKSYPEVEKSHPEVKKINLSKLGIEETLGGSALTNEDISKLSDVTMPNLIQLSISSPSWDILDHINQLMNFIQKQESLVYLNLRQCGLWSKMRYNYDNSTREENEKNYAEFLQVLKTSQLRTCCLLENGFDKDQIYQLIDIKNKSNQLISFCELATDFENRTIQIQDRRYGGKVSYDSLFIAHEIKLGKITSLKLGTKLVDHDDAIVKAVSMNTSIKELDVSYNYFTIGKFESVLKSSTTLTSLNISDNVFSDDDIKNFCEGLTSNKVKLQTLKFSAAFAHFARNFVISTRGIDFISKMLRTQSSLTSLSFTFHPNLKEKIDTFIEAVSMNKTLTNLDLSYNYLSDLGLNVIANMLRTNTNLKILKLVQPSSTSEQWMISEPSPESYLKIIESICKNPESGLESIDIYLSTILDKQRAVSIANTLQECVNKSITSIGPEGLHFDGRIQFHDVSLARIIEGVCQNTTGNISEMDFRNQAYYAITDMLAVEILKVALEKRINSRLKRIYLPLLPYTPPDVRTEITQEISIANSQHSNPIEIIFTELKW